MNAKSAIAKRILRHYVLPAALAGCTGGVAGFVGGQAVTEARNNALRKSPHYISVTGNDGIAKIFATIGTDIRVARVAEKPPRGALTCPDAVDNYDPDLAPDELALAFNDACNGNKPSWLLSKTGFNVFPLGAMSGGGGGKAPRPSEACPLIEESLRANRFMICTVTPRSGP